MFSNELKEIINLINEVILFTFCIILILASSICLHNERNRGNHHELVSSRKKEAKNIKTNFIKQANFNHKKIKSYFKNK